MNGSEAAEPHAWVSRVLASSDVGPMPPDVAARLEQRIERLVAEQAMSTTPFPLIDPPRADRQVPETPVPLSPELSGGLPASPPGTVAGVPTSGYPDSPAAEPPLRLAAGSPFEPSAASAQPPAASAEPPAERPHEGRRTRSRSRSDPAEDLAAGSRRDRRAEAESDRRHVLLRRGLPIAAGLVVLAAAGATTATLLTRSENGDDATLEIAAAESGGETLVPTGLVATGTAYSAEQVESQVQGLVQSVTSSSEVITESTGGSPQPAEQTAPAAAVPGDASAERAAAEAGVPAPGPGADGEAEAEAGQTLGEAPPAAQPAEPAVDVTASPLASTTAYGRCAATVTNGSASTALAIDLATFDGMPAAVVVVRKVDGSGYDVYVTSRDCSAEGLRGFYSVVTG